MVHKAGKGALLCRETVKDPRLVIFCVTVWNCNLDPIIIPIMRNSGTFIVE